MKLHPDLTATIRDALEGDSNDAEHDALATVAAYFGIDYRSPDDDDEDECEGHPAGPNDPMGQTTYCDGSCA